jgi:hypothetical protein
MSPKFVFEEVHRRQFEKKNQKEPTASELPFDVLDE